MTKGKIIREISAGGVVVKKENSQTNVALIRPGNTWCLPKGSIEKGESPEEACQREVQEETGIKGKILEKLGEVNYWYYSREKQRVKKTVYFFLLSYAGGDIQKHDFEVEEVRWFPLHKAKQVLTYKDEKEIMEKAEQKLKGEVS
jgi:mutator protein MutT